MDFITLINEALNNQVPSEEELRAAAESQRGVPEDTMLRVVSQLQKSGGSAVFNDLLEHVGDLAHRLQEPGGIGLSGAAEKIRKLEKILFPRPGWMNLEQELEHALQGNAEYEVAKKYTRTEDERNSDFYQRIRETHPDEIAAKKVAIQQAYKQILPAYVEAHKTHSLPITYAGMLGKRAAIQLGEMDFDGLRETTRELSKYYQENVNTPNFWYRI